MTQPVPDWITELARDADREGAVVRLGTRFLAATDAERAAVYEGWPFGAKWPYPKLLRLACGNGEKFSPRERIVASLVLDSLEGVFGTREHLIALSAKYRSCELAGLSPVAVFESVGAVLLDSHSKALSSFLRRTPDQRATSAFGLVETLNPDGEIEIILRPLDEPCSSS
jgi:hypothetical protein